MGLAESSGLAQLFLRFLRQSFLLLIMIEDDAPILGATINKLSPTICWIDMLPEVIEQFFIGYFRRDHSRLEPPPHARSYPEDTSP